jgi:hypothetical protein
VGILWVADLVVTQVVRVKLDNGVEMGQKKKKQISLPVLCFIKLCNHILYFDKIEQEENVTNASFQVCVQLEEQAEKFVYFSSVCLSFILSWARPMQGLHFVHRDQGSCDPCLPKKSNPLR